MRNGDAIVLSNEANRPPAVRLLASVAMACSLGAAATGGVMGLTLPSWNPPVGRGPTVPDVGTPTKLREPSGRVVVAMVDGLGEQPARGLPHLAELRAKGVFRPLRSHFPTFTSPNVVAMLSGLGPRESGVRLNGSGIAKRRLDTWLSAAHDAGWTVSVHSRQFSAFEAIVGAPSEVEVVSGRLRFATDFFIDPPAAEGALQLVHIGEVDDAGHEHGPESDEYAAAARHADLVVGRLAAQLNPERDVLLVLSDHGHIAGGGHGGDEEAAHAAFFLAAFGPIRAGVELPIRETRDVAPTVAALLGTRTLRHSLGSPMVDILANRSAAVEASLGRAFTETVTRGCALRPTASCEQASAFDPNTSLDEASQLLLRLAAERDQEELLRERRSRLFRGGLVGAAFIVSGVALGRTFLGLRAVAAGCCLALSIVGSYAGALAVQGYRPTLSRTAGIEYFLPDASRALMVALLLSGAAAAVLAKAARISRQRVVAPGVFAVFASTSSLFAYVGWDAAALGENHASALLFMGAPVILVAALVLAISAILERRSKFADEKAANPNG